MKQAFEAAGYRLLYSRNKQQPGYYLAGQPALLSEIKQVLKGSATEVDERQIDIYRKLSFAERFHQGYSISDTARKVVAYLTEFAKKTHDYHLLRQIVWHYRERANLGTPTVVHMALIRAILSSAIPTRIRDLTAY